MKQPTRGVAAAVSAKAALAVSESKTAKWETSQILKSGKDKVVTISNRSITFVRAEKPQGGYVCYMTLHSEWTSAWGRIPKLPLLIDLLNDKDGILLTWKVGNITTLCDWKKKRLDHRTDFDPDIYDLIVAATWNTGSAGVLKCP